MNFEELLLAEINRHPKSKVRDIYKFTYQAVFGSEHAVKDTISARKLLENEVNSLDYSLLENLFDHISPDGRLVRVNLRTYIIDGYDIELLLDAFIKTANEFKGSVEVFNEYWAIVEKMAMANEIKFSLSELRDFYKEMSSKGFPAVDHSKEYKEKYMPSYRVIDIGNLKLFSD